MSTAPHDLADDALAAPRIASARQDATHVLVVDDDPAMCALLREFLAARGYACTLAADTDEAIRRFQGERPAAVILDVVLPGPIDGLGLLATFKKLDRDVPVIVLSGQGRTATVVHAMKLGAADFVGKPFDDLELEVPLANALKQRQLAREVAHLRQELQSHSQRHLLFGQGERMAEVRELIERVSDTDVTVLVRGESGTGKELVARAVHQSSTRRDRAFVKVNCAALPTDLLESELFGFERGAFTGAIQHKPGKFEFANHGTMFLDEIGEMSAPLQAKLLQVLQDGEFSRLGGKQDVRVDVRIVAATNRDLQRAVAEGLFREDLFFRLNVVAITLPPLRERRDEIPVLSEYFLKKYSVQYHKPLVEIGAETMRLMLDYDWPGNVRELENLIKRYVVLGSDQAIRKEIRLPAAVPTTRAGGAASAAGASAQVPARAATPSASALHGTSGAPGMPSGSGTTTAAQPIAGSDRPVNGSPARAPLVQTPPVEIAQAALDEGNYSLKDVSRAAAREAERVLIARMLQQTRWNRKETAEILGISYKALLYKIKENGLDKVS